MRMVICNLLTLVALFMVLNRRLHGVLAAKEAVVYEMDDR
jgi:hypothetical protein